MSQILTDQSIRQTLRAELPATAFKRRPLQTLYLIPAIAIVILASCAIVSLSPHVVWKFVLAVIIGNVYGSLFFFGHHLLHGSMVRHRKLQDALMFFCTGALGLSPHLWRVWHHNAHHPYTNEVDSDPDNFGTLERYRQRPHAKLFVAIMPGNARWIRTAIYLMTFFPIQAQAVLWKKSRQPKGFAGLSRRRALFETLAIIAFWVVVGVTAGPRNVLFVLVIPWLIANYVTLSYIVTQHMLRPMNGRTTLETTMSVTVHPLLDALHWFNSHHVEHHLFPTLPFNELPAVRRAILKRYPEQYLAPPYATALLAVACTPRLYDGNDLVDPDTNRRVSLHDVEVALRKGTVLSALYPRVERNHHSH